MRETTLYATHEKAPHSVNICVLFVLENFLKNCQQFKCERSLKCLSVHCEKK